MADIRKIVFIEERVLGEMANRPLRRSRASPESRL